MIELWITEDGEVHCLAPDDLDLRVVGRLCVRRASHVEFDNEQQGWTVTWPSRQQMSMLFATRQEALDAERKTLNSLICFDRIEEVF